ncbi:iron ABC transporter, partial [Vibrio cyclitrophicus]
DEPAAPLDIAQEALLYKLIERVAEKDIAVIMANHDLNRTLRHADQVLLLEKGVLQASGSAEQVLVPEQLESVFNTQVKSISVDNQTY